MLESLDNVNQTLVEMTGFLEVAVWQHLTDAGVDEVGARGVLLGEFGTFFKIPSGLYSIERSNTFAGVFTNGIAN